MDNSRWTIAMKRWQQGHRLLTIDHRLFFVALCLILISHQANAQRPDPIKLKQWEAMGDTLMSQQQYPQATKYYTKIIDATKLSEKADYNTLYKRAISQYYTEGQHDLALIDVDRFIKEFPAVPQSHILRALIYRIKEDGDKQLEDLNFALQFQPANPGLLKWRAGLLLDKEEYEKAKLDAQRAIYYQDDPEAEAYLAFAFFNLEQPDSALLAINRAIELDYSYVPAYLYAGSFCLQSGEYELAMKYLSLGARVDSENAALWFYKGAALIELEQIDQACSCLNKAFYMGYDDASGYLEEYCYKTEDP